MFAEKDQVPLFFKVYPNTIKKGIVRTLRVISVIGQKFWKTKMSRGPIIKGQMGRPMHCRGKDPFLKTRGRPSLDQGNRRLEEEVGTPTEERLSLGGPPIGLVTESQGVSPLPFSLPTEGLPTQRRN